MTNHVSFKNVDKTYDGDNLIIDDLNLSITKGEFVTMLGPSGSGKTTTLMMLAGFETVTKGEIFIDDKPISKTPPNKRNLGLVFQNYALFPHMTVSENLAFPLTVRKYSAEDTKKQVAKALAMVRLENFGQRRISQLSGGQKQRVAVARALVFEPDLVLMDEPLGALDKNLREEMQYEIKHLHESLGKTFIYVTHDQTEALTMSDKIAVFDQGKIKQYAPPKALYEEPNCYFVSNFIGENNAFHVSVDSIDSNYCQLTMQDKQTMKAVNVDVKANDTKAIVAIRPEKIILNPEANNPNYNYLTAKVVEIIYLGDHVRVRFECAGNADNITKIPNTAKKITVEVDHPLTLGLPIDDCRAFSPQ